MSGSVRVEVEVSLAPAQAFELLVDEITTALAARGLSLESPSPAAKVTEGGTAVGEVTAWSPAERIALTWHPKPWDPSSKSEVLIGFEATESGTKVSVEQRRWATVVGDEGGELLGWFAYEVAAPFLSATSPSRIGDWITDRSARKPSGARSRGFYADPIYHWPNFFAILDVLRLAPSDNLVEIGCGGGAFLGEALKTGCSAAATDHSPDMVKLATEKNRAAVQARRLSVALGDAGSLPYDDRTFTCAVMTGVLGFIRDPEKAFGEVFRVLGSGGRFVAFTGSKALRGTPAAPEPAASRLHFYEDEELVRLALGAGFATARVDHPSLYAYAKRAGVPDADLALFKGTGGAQLLVAARA